MPTAPKPYPDPTIAAAVERFIKAKETGEPAELESATVDLAGRISALSWPVAIHMDKGYMVTKPGEVQVVDVSIAQRSRRSRRRK